MGQDGAMQTINFLHNFYLKVEDLNDYRKNLRTAMSHKCLMTINLCLTGNCLMIVFLSNVDVNPNKNCC